MDGHHGGERSDDGRHLVGECDGRERGRAVGFAIDVGEPRHGFGQRGETRSVPIRAALPESGDAGDHQSWIGRVQGLRGQAECLELAGAEVLHEDIGGVEETTEHVEVVRRLEVEDHGALAPAGDLPEQRHAVGGVSPPHGPHRVTRAGSLDLDDVSTEIGEMTRAPRSGEHRGDVDDTQIGQRPCGGIHSATLSNRGEGGTAVGEVDGDLSRR